MTINIIKRKKVDGLEVWQYPSSSGEFNRADLLLNIIDDEGIGHEKLIRNLDVSLTDAQALQEAKYILGIEKRIQPQVEVLKYKLRLLVDEFKRRKELSDLGLEIFSQADVDAAKQKYQQLKQEIATLGG